MGTGRGVIEVVTGYYFVLDALVVVLQAMVSVITLEHVQVLHRKLLSF